jgi:regulator of sirC expression with transglutaminase-like and TPR domain
VDNKSEIRALINLIDDPDESIFNQIRDKLVSFGEEVIPELELVWENNSFGLMFQTRIEDIIHQIQFESVKVSLDSWLKKDHQDLLEGALIVARYQFPDLDEDKVRKQIELIRRDIWLELNPNLTAFETARVFNHILFTVHGFTGNKKNFHAPQNSYINQVLSSKKGNPLSLSVVYIVLAQLLDVPVYGINLPNHFVLGYADDNKIWDENNTDENQGILFYINPFSRGTFFNKQEIEQFLKQLNVKPKAEYFQPCSHKDIIKRMIINLIFAYEGQGSQEKVEEIKELLDLFK